MHILHLAVGGRIIILGCILHFVLTIYPGKFSSDTRFKNYTRNDRNYQTALAHKVILAYKKPGNWKREGHDRKMFRRAVTLAEHDVRICLEIS